MPKKLFAKVGKGGSLRSPPEAARPAQTLTKAKDTEDSHEANRRREDQRWNLAKETLYRAAVELAQRRAQMGVTGLSELTSISKDDSVEVITRSLEDPSPEVRNAAVRALYRLDPEFAASFFNRALREGSHERRRKIGAALAGSGLVGDAINNLKGERDQNLYGAFSLLFLVAKAGEVQPLISVVEDHPSIELRLALIELLALSGEAGIVPVFRRLVATRTLPSEVRSAVMEAIYQLSSQTREISQSHESAPSLA